MPSCVFHLGWRFGNLTGWCPWIEKQSSRIWNGFAEARERALADAALAHGVAQAEVRRPVPDAGLAGATPWASRSGTLLQPEVRRDPEEVDF